MTEQGNQTVLDEAKDYLVQGKRFMALEDYQSATDCLEQSCQLFDAYYGVAKRECADAYLEYGLALVALANVEAGTDKILKNANNNNEEEEDEDEEEEREDDEEGEEDDEQGEENGLDNEQKLNQEAGDVHKENGTNSVVSDDKKDLKEKNKVDTEAASSTDKSDIEMQESSNGVSTVLLTKNPEPDASDDDPQPGTSGEQTKDTQDDDQESEDATTIEIAWEVLCLAKRLYMTDESLEAQLKLAETLQKLGEISIEWDNNDNAVSILQECLRIRTAILSEDDRVIASTYYHLGLAYSFKQETQDANDSFQSAINVIEKRIGSHSKLLDLAKINQDTVAIAAYEKEINELKELLPEMAMRIDDTKEEDPSASSEAFKRTREEMMEEDEKLKKVCSDKSKPVDDITHLVKRKAP